MGIRADARTGRGTNMTEIGASVTVRGTSYRVVDRRSTNASGAKFYGRYVFTLMDGDGRKWKAYGKAVSHNSTLREVES